MGRWTIDNRVFELFGFLILNTVFIYYYMFKYLFKNYWDIFLARQKFQQVKDRDAKIQNHPLDCIFFLLTKSILKLCPYLRVLPDLSILS